MRRAQARIRGGGQAGRGRGGASTSQSGQSSVPRTNAPRTLTSELNALKDQLKEFSQRLATM